MYNHRFNTLFGLALLRASTLRHLLLQLEAQQRATNDLCTYATHCEEQIDRLRTEIYLLQQKLSAVSQ